MATHHDIDRDIDDILATNPAVPALKAHPSSLQRRVPPVRLGYTTSESATAAMQSSATMKTREGEAERDVPCRIGEEERMARLSKRR